MAKQIQPYSSQQEKIGSWLINRVGRWQTAVYEMSGGRLWNTFLGGPVAILTVVGRKTGVVRKIPLLYLRHGDNVVMTASKGGMSQLPVWYNNVVAADTVDIQIGRYYSLLSKFDESRHAFWKASAPTWAIWRSTTEVNSSTTTRPGASQMIRARSARNRSPFEST